MSMLIAGIGTSLPPHRISTIDAAEIAKRFACDTSARERHFEGLYRRSGVGSRHCVVLNASEGDLDARQSFYGPSDPTTRTRMAKYEAEAGALAVASAVAALEDAAIAPARVTHLVTVSCSGFHAPGVDIDLIKRLRLAPEVARTHVGFMGCHGALNGLRVARAFVEADPDACVLLSAVELCSLHHQYGWGSDRIVANALFADGAATVVGLPARSSRPGLRLVASGSSVIADSEDAMGWRIGDHGFEMTLSPRVPELIGQHLRPWLESWLAAQALSIATVGSWAVHPGGPRILAAVGEATGIGRPALEASYRTLSELGNMSSPTVLFILDRLRRAAAPRPSVALAFGPGLTIEAAVFA
jgi:predicted naringenin-chalcone synthase